MAIDARHDTTASWHGATGPYDTGRSSAIDDVAPWGRGRHTTPSRPELCAQVQSRGVANARLLRLFGLNPPNPTRRGKSRPGGSTRILTAGYDDEVPHDEEPLYVSGRCVASRDVSALEVGQAYLELHHRLHRLVDQAMTAAGLSLARAKVLMRLSERGPMNQATLAAHARLRAALGHRHRRRARARRAGHPRRGSSMTAGLASFR